MHTTGISEKVLLFQTLAKELTRVKTREELMVLALEKLQSCFLFTDLALTLYHEDIQTYTIFAQTLSKKKLNNDAYEFIKDRNFPINDGIHNVALSADQPVCIFIEIENCLSHPGKQLGIDWLQQVGIKKMLQTKLCMNDKILGFMNLLSDDRDAFQESDFNLLQGLADLVAVAVNNILHYEEIQQRDREKSQLFELSSSMASVRDKTDWLNLVNIDLKRIFPFSHNVIGIFNQSDYTCHPFILDPASRARFHHQYEQARYDIQLVRDNFLHDALSQPGVPLVFKMEELINHPACPLFIWINYDLGIREILVIALHHEGGNTFFMILFAKRIGTFGEYALSVMRNISYHFTMALANIAANENLERGEKEKTALLEFSNQLSLARDKQIFSQVIQNKLKELIDYDGFVIRLLSSDGQMHYTFLKASQNDFLKQVGQSKNDAVCPVDDGFFSQVLLADHPVIMDVEQMRSQGEVIPDYIDYEGGIRESIGVSLTEGNKTIGALFILQEKKGRVDCYLLRLVQGLSYQIAINVANILYQEDVARREQENGAILEINKFLMSIKSKEDIRLFFKDILSKFIAYTDSNISLYNNQKKNYTTYLYHVSSETKCHPKFKALVSMEYPDQDYLDAFHEPTYFDLAQVLTTYVREDHGLVWDIGFREFLTVKLQKGNKTIGIVNLLSKKRNVFKERDLTLLQKTSFYLAPVIATVIANEEIQRREKEKSFLLEFSNQLSQVRDRTDLCGVIRSGFQNIIDYDHLMMFTVNSEDQMYATFLHVSLDNQFVSNGEQHYQTTSYTLDDGFFDQWFTEKNLVVLDLETSMMRSDIPSYIQFAYQKGMRESIAVLLKNGDKILGVLFIARKQKDDMEESYLRLIESISHQIAICLAGIIANTKIVEQLAEISRYKEQLEEEKLYLQEEVGSNLIHQHIIGSGEAMQKVFQLVSLVSSSDSTVLVLGETGTGKELIARAIHDGSKRRDRLLVKVNCATLPSNLIESELFGHERGSFTGANERRIGKFELANKGTLFLDEIGEMPLDLQVKLLRALQEREIERVGGKEPIKIDVRIIAATNRDLRKEVAEGRFRSDLYYRLDVFPIVLPPLRERKEDIPVLANHFTKRFGRNAGKKNITLSNMAIKELSAYFWPGNVRELEHVIERSVLLTTGKIIQTVHLPTEHVHLRRDEQDDDWLRTYEENEKEHILKVLNKCNGKIFGPGGAAEILQLNVSTLNSKIKKLGIVKVNTKFERS